MTATAKTPKTSTRPKTEKDKAEEPGIEKPSTAKLFMHGRSQAVRLPKEFRFEGTEVKVSKVGDKVVLEPIKKKPIDLDAWFAELDALGARDFLPEGIPEDPPAEPDPRVFFDE